MQLKEYKMQLYVGGLSENTTEADLKEFFSLKFQVQSITFLRDLESGKKKKSALVMISKMENVENTIQQIASSTLQGVKIIIRRMPDTLPGEMDFREWLSEHPDDVLKMIGAKEGQTILDYGCGPGIFSIPASRLVGKDGKVYALDVRVKMLELIREKAAGEGLINIKPMLFDASRPDINLQDEIVDMILVYDVMHEITDRLGLLRELYRVGRRGSILSIFPMHMGSEKMLEVMKDCNSFHFTGCCCPPGYKGASEILNFAKI
jgi:2-polyprenyl-3-methyl-5-hydroxy-6-metoxy-1,4-benzoquinol methylase